MALTDGPLVIRPILALRALQDAGVTLTAKAEEDAEGRVTVRIEAVWRAEVEGGQAIPAIPIVVAASADTLEGAAESVLRQIRSIQATTAAEAARVAGTPARAW